MTRSRMKLNLIENRSRRKACYRKRKRGLIKKIEELTTLCGVEACIIIYSNFDSEPQIWPPDHSALMEIIHKFKSLSVLEQNRKTMTQESFTIRRIKKLLDQCKKLRKDNRQNEIGLFVSETLYGVAIENFNLPDLKAMRRPIYSTMDSVSRQIEAIKEKESPYPTLSLMLPNMETAAFLAENNENNQPVVAQEEVADVGYNQNPTTRDIMNMMVHSPVNTANSYYQSAVVAPEMNNFQNSMTVPNELIRFGPGFGYRPMMAQQNPTWSMNMSMNMNMNMNMNTVIQNQQPTPGLLFPSPYFMNGLSRNSGSSFGLNPVVQQPEPSRRHEQSPAGSNTTDWISILLRDMQGSAGNTGFFGPP